MSIYDELLSHIKIPKFAKVNYHLPNERLEDPAQATIDALASRGVLDTIKPGASICITAGSREVDNAAIIIKAVVDEVKKRGGNPFIIPAMGSHGGATVQGQTEILRTFGITEETMGVPIKATMETVEIGIADNGMPVHIDKYASEADGIIVLHRIKAHTDFRGRIESGLMKMIAIGMGKQYGANICHKAGPFKMSENITSLARCVIKNKPILFFVGIIENAFHNTYKIIAIPTERVEEEEPLLLEESKSLMPKIPFKKADTLIVDEIGKDISGAGMDPNVTGRSCVLGRWEPNFEMIVVRDITEKSHHNFTGLGNADATTMRAYNKIDWEVTYPNCITARDSISTKIPVVMPNDELAIKFCLQVSFDIDWDKGPKIVWIKNTLSLSSFYISEALIEDAKMIQGIDIVSEPMEIVFDEEGYVKGL